MRPRLGFNAKMPHQPAGRRTEPPMSVPSGTGTPRVAMFSWIVTGTPSSAPCGSPFAPFSQRASLAFAAASAASDDGSKHPY